jgi:hypothetical protein
MARRKDSEGWEDSEGWKRYVRDFRKDGLPKIMNSAVALSIIGGDGKDFDTKQATEIGAILLLGKPLLLVAMPGAKIPAGLLRASDMIVFDWTPSDEESQERLRRAIQEMVGNV